MTDLYLGIYTPEQVRHCELAYTSAREYIRLKNPISSEAMTVYASLREHCHGANIHHRDVLKYVRAEKAERDWNLSGRTQEVNLDPEFE